jgi:prepilin-type N-terminal cleavage/methylation domain-containing protein
MAKPGVATLRFETADRGSRAFTLLEMVAVLFVVGMTSSIVIPRLPALQSSLDFALKRQSFEQNMNGLAYRALRDGQDFVFSGTYNAAGRIGPAPKDTNGDDALPGDMTVLPITDTPRVMPPPILAADVTPPMPEGWNISFPSPIQYRSSGYCSGGIAEVEVGAKHYTYRLEPPLCEVELER